MKKQFELKIYPETINSNKTVKAIKLYFTKNDINSSLFLKIIFEKYNLRSLYINNISTFKALEAAINENNNSNILEAFKLILNSIKWDTSDEEKEEDLIYIKSDLQIDILKELFSEYNCMIKKNKLLIYQSKDASYIRLWNKIMKKISKLHEVKSLYNISQKEFEAFTVDNENDLLQFLNLKTFENDIDIIKLLKLFRNNLTTYVPIKFNNSILSKKEYFFLYNVNMSSIQYILIDENGPYDFLIGSFTFRSNKYSITINANRFASIFCLNFEYLKSLFENKKDMEYVYKEMPLF